MSATWSPSKPRPDRDPPFLPDEALAARSQAASTLAARSQAAPTLAARPYAAETLSVRSQAAQTLAVRTQTAETQSVRTQTAETLAVRRRGHSCSRTHRKCRRVPPARRSYIVRFGSA
jgi:hypothetical protein